MTAADRTRSTRSAGKQVADLAAAALPAAPAAGRVPPAPAAPRTAYLQVIGLVVLFFGPGTINAGLALAGQRPAAPVPTVGTAVPAAMRDLAVTAAAVWLVVLLARSRGLTGQQLGWAPALPRELKLRQGLAVGVLYGLAIGVALSLLLALRRVAGGGQYPSEPEGAWGALTAVTGSLSAGVVEELVLVAALVTFLEQARQPWWRIMALGLLARLSFHLYYGEPSTGLVTAGWVLLWAAVALLLFKRTRRLTPLIVIHVLYNLHTSFIGSFGDRSDRAVIAVTLALYLGAAVLWAILLGRRREIDDGRAGQRDSARQPVPAG